MTAWPRSATNSERLMSPLRRSAALAACALSLSFPLFVHGCGSGALHRATEERQSIRPAWSRCAGASSSTPIPPAMRSPKNVPPALSSIRV